MQPNRWPPVADDERGNRDLQPIEQVRLEKHRDGYAAALHENAMTATRAQEARDLRDV